MEVSKTAGGMYSNWSCALEEQMLEQCTQHGGTVTPKSVTITNLKPGRAAPHNHLWECHFTLVGPNKVPTLGYKSVPGSCELAHGLQRYGNSNTGTPL